MKYRAYILCALFFPNLSMAAVTKPDEPVFQLVMKYTNAKITTNYSPNLNGNNLVHQMFTPVAGSNDVFLFRSAYQGKSYEGGERTFHDSMVIEADKKGHILKACSYTEEWAEGPLSTDLFCAQAKGMEISKVNNVKELKFISDTNADDWGPKGTIEWAAK